MRIVRLIVPSVILCAGILIASCGSGSNSASTSTSTNAPTSTSTNAPAPTATPANDKAIIEAAEADLTAQLGKPAKLNVVSLKTSQGWAFVYSKIQEPNGQPIDYRGTPFEEAAANGGKSKKYVGLFRDDQGWKLVTSRVGPTDVAWQNWSAEYSAPPEIFELPPE